MADASDYDLLQRWRSGDADAGSRLVERQFSTVFRFFRRKVADPDVARELAQKTFVTCLEVRENLREEVRFKAFVLGIARNMLLRHLRAGANTREETEGDVDRAAVSQPSPSLMMAMREEQRLLLAALRRLPLDLQLTLELYYWEELTTQEIARVLDIAQGTVKWRLSRARELLREEIEAIGVPEVVESTIRDLDRWAQSVRKLVDGD